jgi:hypothetical protein
VPDFTGDLVIREGASLQASKSGMSVIPTAPQKLILKEGSRLILGSGVNLQTFGPILLDGKAEIHGGFSTQGHNTVILFKEEVTGAQRLVLSGVNGNLFRLAAKNSFTKGFFARSGQAQGFRIKAEAAGCFGSAYVQIGPNATLILAAEETIDDRAELKLLGAKHLRSEAKLILDVNETVGRLSFGETGDETKVPQKPGTWGAPKSGAQHESELIFGKGILTVLK